MCVPVQGFSSIACIAVERERAIQSIWLQALRVLVTSQKTHPKTGDIYWWWLVETEITDRLFKHPLLMQQEGNQPPSETSHGSQCPAHRLYIMGSVAHIPTRRGLMCGNSAGGNHRTNKGECSSYRNFIVIHQLSIVKPRRTSPWLWIIHTQSAYRFSVLHGTFNFITGFCKFLIDLIHLSHRNAKIELHKKEQLQGFKFMYFKQHKESERWVSVKFGEFPLLLRGSGSQDIYQKQHI